MDEIENVPHREYAISVNTDNLQEAIASVGSALYGLMEEALTAHEDHEGEDCEFEAFARDVLGVLMRHAEQLSADAVWSDQEHQGSG